MVKKLTELDHDSIGRYQPDQDNVDKKKMGDKRMPKLTLKMINRLKKIRASKSLETHNKKKILGVMYGVPAEGEEGGGGGGGSPF
jgi:hypothetical protein